MVVEEEGTGANYSSERARERVSHYNRRTERGVVLFRVGLGPTDD